jgi:hypothetical protein
VLPFQAGSLPEFGHFFSWRFGLRAQPCVAYLQDNRLPSDHPANRSPSDIGVLDCPGHNSLKPAGWAATLQARVITPARVDRISCKATSIGTASSRRSRSRSDSCFAISGISLLRRDAKPLPTLSAGWRSTGPWRFPVSSPCAKPSFRSWNASFFSATCVCFCNGHARALSQNMDINVYMRALSPAGTVYGQPLDGDVK